MATFREELADVRDSVMLDTDLLAEEITYTPGAGDASTIPAVIERQEHTQEQTDQGEYLVREATLVISSASANGIETPVPENDTVTFDSITWGIVDYEPIPLTGTHRLLVKHYDLLNKRVRRF